MRLGLAMIFAFGAYSHAESVTAAAERLCPDFSGDWNEVCQLGDDTSVGRAIIRNPDCFTIDYGKTFTAFFPTATQIYGEGQIYHTQQTMRWGADYGRLFLTEIGTRITHPKGTEAESHHLRSINKTLFLESDKLIRVRVDSYYETRMKSGHLEIKRIDGDCTLTPRT